MNLGSHLLIVMPGKLETTGGQPPILSATEVDLTIDDAVALMQSQSIRRVAPMALGNAPVSYGQRERAVNVIGSTAGLYGVRKLKMLSGRFLPAGDPTRGAAIAVIGDTLKTELFGNAGALGERIRIDGQKFQVIGVLKEASGSGVGMDLRDSAVIPVATAQDLFDSPSLFRVMVEADGHNAIPRAEKAIIDILRTRHNGEEDVTVITQDAMLETFNAILGSLTLAVGGIAAISLAVAGVLIMNVMLVAVSQRKTEIGLLKAIGSPSIQILRLFLAEACMLALLGAIVGLILGFAGVWGLATALPDFPIGIPLWAPIAATATSLGTGLVFCFLPARRAAKLDPVLALAGH
jgi:putative ABC transport system permease protein